MWSRTSSHTEFELTRRQVQAAHPLFNTMSRGTLDAPKFWSAVVIPDQMVHVDLFQEESELHLTNIVLDTNNKGIKSVTLRAHTDSVRNGSIIAILRPGKIDNVNINLTFFPSDKYVRLSIENIVTNAVGKNNNNSSSSAPKEWIEARQSISIHVSGTCEPA
jgi:hypothetical protein